MKIPRRFKLKGHRWHVKYKHQIIVDGDECDGVCYPNSRTIVLQKNLSPRRKVATFLHELFHATLFEAHIAMNVRLSEGVEEVICDAFADLITSTLKTYIRE